HGLPAALKIRDENLDAAAGHPAADSVNREAEQLCSAILAIVAIDAGDNSESQAHRGDRFGHTVGLPVIHFERRTLLHGTEAAAACADVAQDHERGGPAVPAFSDVRTCGAFANRVEMQALNQRFQFAIILAGGSGSA